jgi:RNA polymerase sigma factor (sigma-70 family)
VKAACSFGHSVYVSRTTAVEGVLYGARRHSTDAGDAEAIRRSLTDPVAFTAVFDRHFRAVHRYLHRRGGRDLADELAGETFRVAFEGRARWSQTTPDARPWLLGIATNLLRRHRRTEERRLRALARRGVDKWTMPDEAALVERADARQARAVLAAALAELSPDDRDVVLLVALGDLAYEDVAQALGIPEGTVASRLNRARRVLAAMLPSLEEDDRG